MEENLGCKPDNLSGYDLFDFLYKTRYYTTGKREIDGIWAYTSKAELSSNEFTAFFFPKGSNLLLVNACDYLNQVGLSLFEFLFSPEEKEFVSDFIKRKNLDHADASFTKEMIATIYAKKYKYEGVIYCRGQKKSVEAQDLRTYTIEELKRNFQLKIYGFSFDDFEKSKLHHRKKIA